MPPKRFVDVHGSHLNANEDRPSSCSRHGWSGIRMTCQNCQVAKIENVADYPTPPLDTIPTPNSRAAILDAGNAKLS